MRGGQDAARAPVIQFTNCRILRGGALLREDLWVRGGRILDPEKLFFEERRVADEQRDCGGCILAPGFIDVQINGGFGVDFSQASEDVGSGVALVARRILSHGVTSFCPTLVTSPLEVYHKVLPQIPVKSGGPHGAGVLGVHLEGPFISREKRGAHPEAHLRSFEADAFQDVLATYGGLDNVRIVTLAPELGHSHEVIRALTALGICVSLGHSVADLGTAEEAVQSGATFITHLFNAMLPFHHRDPGIVGLLTSDQLPTGRRIFYGMIADGIHTNPAALRIAHRAHPKGLVLVTDAVPALGLGNGRHTLGQQEVEVDGLTAYVAGTNTLSGSIAPMDTCVRHFLQATGCSVESALEAASLHPAQLLGLEKRKGTLDFGADAGCPAEIASGPWFPHPSLVMGTAVVLPLPPSHRPPLTQTSWCSMTLFTSGPPTSRVNWCGRRRRPGRDPGPPLEGMPSPSWTLSVGHWGAGLQRAKGTPAQVEASARSWRLG
ncbi:N-acetylglucosamine-6-phosphate deacetylase isoform X1 [Moschus berezovskii]|uniref:N-acetylglucosamine-6-phosphate deacetylase isoform X1 n=1 Tax=Moschus berezovskii TaxID=68408 RepID=UPI00244485DB|nr:N-acetylglucosamine-6-phosphate deacetylase isoform X1 [Moschus berezovskii]